MLISFIKKISEFTLKASINFVCFMQMHNIVYVFQYMDNFTKNNVCKIHTNFAHTLNDVLSCNIIKFLKYISHFTVILMLMNWIFESFQI